MSHPQSLKIIKLHIKVSPFHIGQVETPNQQLNSTYFHQIYSVKESHQFNEFVQFHADNLMLDPKEEEESHVHRSVFVTHSVGVSMAGHLGPVCFNDFFNL